MIVQLSADAPLLVRALAGAALAAHVGGASLGIASGFVSLLARKGFRLHRLAGNVFFGAMLAMSGAAAITAPLLPDRFSALMGLFVFYLVITAWMVVKRPAGTLGNLEKWVVVVPLVVAGANLWLARLGANAPHKLIDGEPSQLGYIVAVIATLSAAADLSMIRRGGVVGAARTARHLWRMCLALFIAAGSAVGQPRVTALLPAEIRHSALLLFTPALIVLALMVFWLIRVRVPKRRRAAKPQLLPAT